MRFHVLELALSIIRSLRKLLFGVRKCDGKLANQIRDAANSFVLNIAEGNRRQGRDRLHLWNIAAGSADEVRVALRAAVSWGYLRERDVAGVLARLDHLLAILWKLTH